MVAPQVAALDRFFPAAAVFISGLAAPTLAIRSANRLSASLPSGKVLTVANGAALAELLSAHGVGVVQVQCGDWRVGDSAPTAGQAIAIKLRIRELGNPKSGDEKKID